MRVTIYLLCREIVINNTVNEQIEWSSSDSTVSRRLMEATAVVVVATADAAIITDVASIAINTMGGSMAAVIGSRENDLNVGEIGSAVYTDLKESTKSEDGRIACLVAIADVDTSKVSVAEISDEEGLTGEFIRDADKQSRRRE